MIKKKTPNKQLNVRINTEIIKKARKLAKTSKMRLGSVVEEAIRQYLQATGA